jgi:hypothetical protein
VLEAEAGSPTPPAPPLLRPPTLSPSNASASSATPPRSPQTPAPTPAEALRDPLHVRSVSFHTYSGGLGGGPLPPGVKRVRRIPCRPVPSPPSSMIRVRPIPGRSSTHCTGAGTKSRRWITSTPPQQRRAGDSNPDGISPGGFQVRLLSFRWCPGLFNLSRRTKRFGDWPSARLSPLSIVSGRPGDQTVTTIRHPDLLSWVTQTPTALARIVTAGRKRHRSGGRTKCHTRRGGRALR